MPAPATTDAFLEYVRKSGLFEQSQLDNYLASRPELSGASPAELSSRMVADGMLTEFQGKHLMRGRYRNFFIGKFKVLEPLGSGGMSQVYLCEHAVMKHRVAMKLLPIRDSEDKSAVSRFIREARAAAAVNHPNVVRAHDFDLAEKKFYYLIMDFVDGCNLHDLVKKAGPLPPEYAAHYISQVAAGLQHIHECNLVHRDLKPSNLLLDRNGVVRILDLGLARFTDDDQDNLTKQLQGKSIIGTADYLAPEQAIQSDNIDIRADIYSLGATMYFLLSGRAPFESQSVTQKLLAHQIRDPDPLMGVPEEMSRVVMTMMAKQPEDRYGLPADVIDALAPWTAEPLPPPDEEWFQIRAGSPGSPSGGSSQGNHAPPPSTSALANQNTPSRMQNPLARQSGPVNATKTAPALRSSRQIQTSPKRQSRITQDPGYEVVESKSRKGLYIGMAALVGLLIIGGVVGAMAIGGWGKKDVTGSGSGGTTNPQGSGSPQQPDAPVPPVPPPAGAIVVGPQGVPSIAKALEGAKPGDRIVVTLPRIRESVVFNAKARGVTIESWPIGRIVPWQPPADHSPGKPMIQISNVDGFRIKGFDFDGTNQADVLLSVTGVCPGLSLESSMLRGFRQAGIDLVAALGAPERPIRMDGLRFLGNLPQSIGVRVSRPTAGDAGTKFISITNNRFEGTSDRLGAAMRVSAPLEETDLRFNRFFKLTRGLHYVRNGDPAPLVMTLANNTFFDIETCFGFDAVPPSGSGLTVMNNLFLKSPRVATTAGVNGQPECTVPDWVWHSADVKRKDGKVVGYEIGAGTRYFRKSFELQELPKQDLVLDVGVVSTFKIWLNGEPIGEARFPYFEKRVHSFNLKDKLKVGRNTIAIEARHFLDPLNERFGSSAGVMVRIGTLDRDDKVICTTDASWKSSPKSAPGWERSEFDDESWAAVHVWPVEGPVWPWANVVWDSAVKVKLAGAMPLPITSAGNYRDYNSHEGFPLMGTQRGVIDTAPKNFPQDPDDDASFLRVPRGHKLNFAGPEGNPMVGVPPRD